MKRYGLLLEVLLVVSTVAWGAVDHYDTVTIGLTNAVDLMHAEPERGTPAWFEQWRQEHTPVSPAQPAPSLAGIDLGLPRRAKITLTITPSQPSERDEVTVTVSCWRDDSLTCHYVDGADLQVGRLFVTLDLHWQAKAGLCPSSNHSQSLGTFSPGTYFLMVRNHGALGGMASTSFAVTPVKITVATSWWSSFRNGTSPW